MILPLALYGTEKDVRRACRRLARHLYRGKDLDPLFREFEYVEWEQYPADLIIDRGRFGPIVARDDTYWRPCEIGIAMESLTNDLFDHYSSKEQRLQRIDDVLLYGMQHLWFTIATLNMDWVDFWHWHWRRPEDRPEVACRYLAAYLKHARAIQEVACHFRYLGNSGLFGTEGMVLWASHIIDVAFWATNGKSRVDIIRAGGDICAALEYEGFAVP